MLGIGVLCGLMVAAHNTALIEDMSPIYGYVYCFVRVALHGLFFFAARAVIEKYNESLDVITLTALAIAASHVPVVLTVTALDIAIGQPELGVQSAAGAGGSGVSLLLLELFYFIDNHIAICCLLSVPRVILLRAKALAEVAPTTHQTTLLSAITPPLRGEILWVEAQEHYVSITTDMETRLVLARFSDMVRELSAESGLQVHRSHWVNTAAIAEARKNASSLTLLLHTGDTVPVSRRYRQAVDEAFPNALPTH